MIRFDDRVAVITGAASGIGEATARLVASLGGAVVVADIDGSRAQAVAEAIVADGGRAVASVTDVSAEDQIEAMVRTAIDTFGRIDVLHNNAAALGPDALGRDRGVVDMDLELWDRTQAITLRGVMLGCKHAVPHMVSQGGGAIVNTASTAGQAGDFARSAYGAAKAGVENLTRSVATMYGHAGVRCNAVAPGLVLSPAALAQLSDEQLAGFARHRLLAHTGEPNDIAWMVAFLASDLARYVTGQIVNVDGGVLAHFPSYADNLAAHR